MLGIVVEATAKTRQTVLYPEDAWGAGAADVLDQAANDIAADLATLGDRVVCAVLEARGVR